MRARPALPLRVHEYGDAAILVELSAASYEQRWRAAQSLGRRLLDARPAGMLDLVASFEHVLIAFDPLVSDHEQVADEVLELAGSATEPEPARHFLIPTVYGDEHGPDLEPLAGLLGLTPHALVELHTRSTWTVRFVGSPVAAPLMDGPALPQPVPRLATPRARMAPGTVALSGQQCIIYNAASPGGWQAIGRTPAKMYDLTRPPYVAYRAGDTFSFVAIQPCAWEDGRAALEPVTPPGPRDAP